MFAIELAAILAVGVLVALAIRYLPSWATGVGFAAFTAYAVTAAILDPDRNRSGARVLALVAVLGLLLWRRRAGRPPF